jgi:hypothetical protein
MMHAIPNGGFRNEIEAINLKKQGVKAGVLDISMPVPKGKYHGLYIELKYGKGKTSEKQDWWIENLIRYGYSVHVCYGWIDAQQKILEYLRIKG